MASEFCTFQTMDINLTFNRVSPPLIHGSNRKSIRISSFKGSDEHRDRVKVSQRRRNSVKLSYAYLNGGLTSLPTASPNQDRTFVGPSSNERLETDNELKKFGILKTVLCKFWSLDSKIMIPAIIFIPLFLTVNIKYGAHVAKELIPLWIGGPLLVALYMKMVHVVWSLYVFSFTQSVKVVNGLTCRKESIGDRLWKHVVYFRNLDYKDVSKRKWEDFRVWVGDMCLDYVESMWSYRKTVWFLKMAKIM